jgi:hypothetical protein
MKKFDKLLYENSWLYIKKIISLLIIMLSVYITVIIRLIFYWENNIF